MPNIRGNRLTEKMHASDTMAKTHHYDKMSFKRPERQLLILPLLDWVLKVSYRTDLNAAKGLSQSCRQAQYTTSIQYHSIVDPVCTVLNMCMRMTTRACEWSGIGAENGAEWAENWLSGSWAMSGRKKDWLDSEQSGAGGCRVENGAVSGLNWPLKFCSKVIPTQTS